MFDPLKLFSLTHITSTEPIASKSVDFRVLGVKTPLRVELLMLMMLRNQTYLCFYYHQYYQFFCFLQIIYYPFPLVVTFNKRT